MELPPWPPNHAVRPPSPSTAAVAEMCMLLCSEHVHIVCWRFECVGIGAGDMRELNGGGLLHSARLNRSAVLAAGTALTWRDTSIEWQQSACTL